MKALQAAALVDANAKAVCVHIRLAAAFAETAETKGKVGLV
jgi:hypothetical protein